ncbi:methyltransferase, FkbM family [Algoriphagus locisalis]|uniref:Methyltransferase, FkbM family n=1 Tax=Algoriphagus locisalis TaxID=305507 RepID=A0A1I6XUM5_9BACT|nr:FkbM family methyltransferase [Algoriphagus locisalis]SFT41723.1 methyltransferase, FkbM family [Algoriphagus locisalis]
MIKSYFHQHFARPIYSILRSLHPFFKFKKRTFFDKFNVKTKDGVSFFLYNNAFYWETEMFWAGFENFDYEKKTRMIWCQLAKSSQLIFDIGSNSGWFSVMAKAYNPKATVHAFEPQPNIYQVLVKNNEINRFDIHCHQVALSDTKGEFPFYNTGDQTFTTENTNHGSLNKEWRPIKQHSILVKVDRLDDLIESKQILKPDLIKIDVETLEYEVLSGYGSLLHEHKPIIILEIQDKELGLKVGSLYQSEEVRYFHIDESKGLIEVSTLGDTSSQENRNYLICPKCRQDLINPFLN